MLFLLVFFGTILLTTIAFAIYSRYMQNKTLSRFDLKSKLKLIRGGAERRCFSCRQEVDINIDIYTDSTGWIHKGCYSQKKKEGKKDEQ